VGLAACDEPRSRRTPTTQIVEHGGTPPPPAALTLDLDVALPDGCGKQAVPQAQGLRRSASGATKPTPTDPGRDAMKLHTTCTTTRPAGRRLTDRAA
jgi:hypothetical protein